MPLLMTLITVKGSCGPKTLHVTYCPVQSGVEGQFQRGTWEGILCAGYEPKPVTGSTGKGQGPAAFRTDRVQGKEIPEPTPQGLRPCIALQGLQALKAQKAKSSAKSVLD